MLGKKLSHTLIILTVFPSCSPNNTLIAVVYWLVFELTPIWYFVTLRRALSLNQHGMDGPKVPLKAL